MNPGSYSTAIPPNQCDTAMLTAKLYSNNYDTYNLTTGRTGQ